MEHQDIRNWFKLELLLHRSSSIMRQVFKHRWKLHSKTEWKDSAASANFFAKEWWLSECGKVQMKMIKSGDTNNWDITTLGIILRNFSFQNTNPKKLKKENTNIQKIIEIRNRAAHRPSKFIPNNEFEKDWTQITEALVLLGDSFEELEKLRTSNAEGVEFKINAVYQDETNINEAQRLKEEGNKEYNSNNYKNAINFYNRALLLGGILDFEKAILYSNRCIAYLKLYESSNSKDKGVDDLLFQASEDAKQACILRPSWFKGYWRMADTLVAMDKLEEAIEYYNSALALDPSNKDIQNLRSIAKHRLTAKEREDHMDPRLRPTTAEESSSEIDRQTGKPEGYTENLLKMGDQIPLDTKIQLTKGFSTKEEVECLDYCRKGHLYKHGSQSIQVDLVKAASFFSKAASKGGAEGMYNLALCYLNGEGVKKDVEIATKLLLQAAAQSPMMSNGKLKNLGVGEAQHVLGLNYYNGIGVERDLFKAAEWYQKAVSNGIPNSANNLGLMYLNGNGVKRDIEEGIKYLKIAANGKDPNAMETLASHYLQSGDASEGLKWIKRAADTGLVRAQLAVKDYEVAVLSQQKKFKESKTEEWERKNSVGDNSKYSIKERIEERMKSENPNFMEMMIRLQNLESKLKSPTPFKREFSKYKYPELLEYSKKGSIMAKRMADTLEHVFKALSMIEASLESDKIPDIETCIRCVMELSKAYLIEHFCIAVPMIVIKICDTVISRSQKPSKEDEAARICKSVSMMKESDAIQFLTTSIKLYSKNSFLYLARGGCYGILQQFKETLADSEEALKLDPNDYHGLYHRAVALKMLYEPSNEVIEAYLKYLNYAPKDERKVPEAYYSIASSYALLEPQSNKKHEYFNLGLQAEKIQLPCFLPYETNTKMTLEFLFTMNKTGKTSKELPIENENSHFKYKKIDEEMIVQHRDIVMNNRNFTLPPGQVVTSRTVAPTIQPKPISLIGLRPIYLKDMDTFEDHIYEGYVLSVVIMDVPMTSGPSVQTLIQDEKKNIQRIAIYTNPTGKCFRCKKTSPSCDIHSLGVMEEFMYKEYPVGTKLSIVNPFMRLAKDGKPMIRVDDVNTILKGENIQDPCRSCLKSNSSKFCSKCKQAHYCSRECQEYDWKVLKHKCVCFNY